VSQNKIQNARNIPLSIKAGMVPNLQGSFQNYFQPMVFNPVTKANVVGVTQETMKPITFRGMIYPHKATYLQLLKQGERNWTWWGVISDPQLNLKNDDVIIYHGAQYRVMEFYDYRLYNFMQYILIQDWKNAGPTVTP